jgi:ribosome-binding protein aMBF1 (putative translation factor)
MITLDDLAAAVRDGRQGRGWSQEECAERAGVAVRTVRRIEAGERCHWHTAMTILRAIERTGNGRPCDPITAGDAVDS